LERQLSEQKHAALSIEGFGLPISSPDRQEGSPFSGLISPAYTSVGEQQRAVSAFEELVLSASDQNLLEGSSFPGVASARPSTADTDHYTGQRDFTLPSLNRISSSDKLSVITTSNSISVWMHDEL
jgi:hypothetical protein